MKKYIILFAAIISFTLLKSQTFLNIDIAKLNTALSNQKVTGYTFDNVSEFGGIIGSYKDANGTELAIAFDSLSKFKEPLKDKKNIVIQYKKDKTNLIFYENEYIVVLYIELPQFNVTMSLTAYSTTTKEALEKLYAEINPEVLLKSALVK